MRTETWKRLGAAVVITLCGAAWYYNWPVIKPLLSFASAEEPE